MIIAYRLSMYGDESCMLGPDTYRPPASGGFHDWRFGKNGVPHPATCGTCGQKTDPTYVNPDFKVRHRTWDICGTQDGYTIVSRRFRDFCQSQRWEGMDFVTLPADDAFFVLRLSSVLPFNARRREKLCPACGKFYDVIGPEPAFVRGSTAPIEDGFFRSDLEFASGHEQHPIIIVGIHTAKTLKTQRFQKYVLEAVEP